MNEELKPTSADDLTFTKLVREVVKREADNQAACRMLVAEIEKRPDLFRQAMVAAVRLVVSQVRSEQRPSLTTALLQQPCRRDAEACSLAYQGVADDVNQNILDRMFFQGKQARLWTREDCSAAAMHHARIEGVHGAAKQVCLKLREKTREGATVGECVTAREALRIFSDCQRLARRMPKLKAAV